MPPIPVDPTTFRMSPEQPTLTKYAAIGVDTNGLQVTLVQEGQTRLAAQVLAIRNGLSLFALFSVDELEQLVTELKS